MDTQTIQSVIQMLNGDSEDKHLGFSILNEKIKDGNTPLITLALVCKDVKYIPGYAPEDSEHYKFKHAVAEKFFHKKDMGLVKDLSYTNLFGQLKRNKADKESYEILMNHFNSKMKEYFYDMGFNFVADIQITLKENFKIDE